jgi:hypothetical protein
MADFPTSFTSTPETLTSGTGIRGDESLKRLHEKGYTVATGLTEYYAGAVGVMGSQKHIREYCPKDGTNKRFGSLESTEQWLQKGGGRGMFLLLEGEGKGAMLAGYGWTGFGPCDELPDHPITSAYRIGERALGKGLSGDFVQVVVSATNTLYAPSEGIGLETWQSNAAASLYPKIGFELVTQAPEPEMRPSMREDAIDGEVEDLRLYMGYPEELLT